MQNILLSENSLSQNRDVLKVGVKYNTNSTQHIAAFSKPLASSGPKFTRTLTENSE